MVETSILENSAQIAELDRDNLLSGITALPEQLADTWSAVQKVTFPRANEIESVIVAGMGGSGLGADLAITTLADRLLKPVQLIHGYSLPEYVSAKTLVILASFSGTTEEIISCSEEAQLKGAQIAVISAGGPLLELAEKKQLPLFHILPTFNRSQQQRMALGYALLGVIGMLKQAGVCELDDNDIDEVIQTVKDTVIACEVESSVANNPAKHLAFEVIDRQPVLIGAEFLAGALHTATNQLNENAKIFADYKVIPELNHHLMEGFKYPNSNAHHHFFIFIDSDLYRAANHHRLELTQEIIEELDIPNLTMKLKGKSKLAQAFELITTWSFVSIYLAILEGFDPGPLPVVDSFKTKLKERQK